MRPLNLWTLADDLIGLITIFATLYVVLSL